MAYAESPKGLTKWQQFQNTAREFGLFLYNKEKKEVMGRNASSWGKIMLFFFIFYLCLAAFFAAMLNAFLATMPERKEGPKLTQYLAGKSPVRVLPYHKVTFDKDEPNTYDEEVKEINKALKPYIEQTGEDKAYYEQTPCSFNSTKTVEKGEKQCYFDLSKLGPCYSTAKDFDYGYKAGKPCFFLKMNKVFNFVPEPESGLSYLQVTCDKGTIYPKETPGYPVSFFPYRAEEHWLSPLVALKVDDMGSMKIKCNVYGKNIERSETYLLERGAYNRIRIEIN
ncbi:sodium/potassium-transporting ATPase subunit beta-1 [Exaiptasia diaphana]|uniref:Sodium/potassium-transporting ATPase subunit beta n=1 Tax=Exaiptasia diaphana TaxID=2652724 RepID=A0A913XFG6_EXADI|nr:sodium/potassium-transporting ATPase subunit beta-1 [Exaiptasia diaphana]KXJ26213.1 Sodium/potassium-transporting ATPase subunit beta-1 [Exaiptasia diaphana]